MSPYFHLLKRFHKRLHTLIYAMKGYELTVRTDTLKPLIHFKDFH